MSVQSQRLVIVERSLERIRVGLDADGYDLLLALVGPSGMEILQVAIRAREGACEDCLVPKPIFRGILAAALEGVVQQDALDIIYPGEDMPMAGEGAFAAAGFVPDVADVGANGSRFTSRRYEVDDWEAVQRLALEQGWADGLPIVPPTPARVQEHLDAAGLAPDAVIGRAEERDVDFVAEMVAINAVMAGASPEHMRVLVAAIEAVCDPRFKFNHLASLGSPWPLFLVSGPIVEELGLHHSLYLFGPDAHVNSRLSRAFSLSMRNIAHASNSGIQRGQWGNPIRWQCFVGESPDSPWPPLHTERGMPVKASVVTAVSTYPGTPNQISTVDPAPERMLDALCHSMAHWGGAQATRGTYVVMMGPHHAEWFLEQGWSRADVRRYVVENTTATIADLKRRGAWGIGVGEMPPEFFEIQAGDEESTISIFQSNGDLDQYVWIGSAVEERDVDVIIVVTGGDAGRRMGFAVPYQLSTNPVSRRIR